MRWRKRRGWLGAYIIWDCMFNDNYLFPFDRIPQISRLWLPKGSLWLCVTCICLRRQRKCLIYRRMSYKYRRMGSISLRIYYRYAGICHPYRRKCYSYQRIYYSYAGQCSIAQRICNIYRRMCYPYAGMCYRYQRTCYTYQLSCHDCGANHPPYNRHRRYVQRQLFYPSILPHEKIIPSWNSQIN